MTNCKKALAYIALKDIERNGVSDCLEKESTPLVSRSLAPQARKLHSIDELFLAAKRRLRDSMKVAVKKTVVYKTLKVMAPVVYERNFGVNCDVIKAGALELDGALQR